MVKPWSTYEEEWSAVALPVVDEAVLELLVRLDHQLVLGELHAHAHGLAVDLLQLVVHIIIGEAHHPSTPALVAPHVAAET